LSSEPPLWALYAPSFEIALRKNPVGDGQRRRDPPTRKRARYGAGRDDAKRARFPSRPPD
jgi:hypothetical protein